MPNRQTRVRLHSRRVVAPSHARRKPGPRPVECGPRPMECRRRWNRAESGRCARRAWLGATRFLARRYLVSCLAASAPRITHWALNTMVPSLRSQRVVAPSHARRDAGPRPVECRATSNGIPATLRSRRERPLRSPSMARRYPIPCSALPDSLLDATRFLARRYLATCSAETRATSGRMPGHVQWNAGDIEIAPRAATAFAEHGSALHGSPGRGQPDQTQGRIQWSISRKANNAIR